MTDTPGSCGCRVEHDAGVPTYLPYRIIYCPTHAAAFENESLLASFRSANDENARLRWKAEAKVADLLAALEEIRNGRMPQVCEMYEICDHAGCAASYAAFAIADAAIASVKEDADE